MLKPDSPAGWPQPRMRSSTSAGSRPRHLGEQRVDDLRRQIVRADRCQRALVGPADRAACGGDDDGFSHGGTPSSSDERHRSYRRVTNVATAGPSGRARPARSKVLPCPDRAQTDHVRRRGDHDDGNRFGDRLRRRRCEPDAGAAGRNLRSGAVPGGLRHDVLVARVGGVHHLRRSCRPSTPPRRACRWACGRRSVPMTRRSTTSR